MLPDLLCAWHTAPVGGIEGAVQIQRVARRAAVRKQVVVALGLAVVVAAASAQTDFRCAGQLIDLGTSEGVVLELCGEPNQVAEGSDEIGEGVAIPVEEWLYNYGPTMLPSLLIFRNGSLAAVKTLDGFPPA